MDAVIDLIIAKYNYWMYIVLMMIGLFGMIAKKNLIKKIIGMNIFQTAIILFYVSIVAVATLGVALALAIKVYRQYHTLEEDEIIAQIRE